jgi:hypothetical protein
MRPEGPRVYVGGVFSMGAILAMPAEALRERGILALVLIKKRGFLFRNLFFY